MTTPDNSTNGQSGDRWIDPEADPVSVYQDYEPDLVDDDEPVDTGADPVAESTLVEFVERFNARDVDGLEELIADDAEAELLSARGRDDLAEGFMELWERYPSLLLTRGDVDDEPVAAAWVADTEREDFDLVGVLRFVWDDSGERISRVDLVEAPDETVLERPDPAELPEWADWRVVDEG